MNIKENITRLTDLKENDSLSSYMNHTAQQSHNAYEVFYEFLKEVKPKQILEIGTALGGFTNFLKLCINDLDLPTKILSYDIYERSWYKDMVESGIDVRVEDVFDFVALTVKQEVVNFIKQEGVTIVLCDGGWKIGEFKILSEHIKHGDFILAHDYAENKQVFESNIRDKVWNWHEVQDSDIREASDRNNLEIYKKETFENVAWTCRVKNKV